MTVSITGAAQAADPENTLAMEVSTGGTVTIELRPDIAPQHAARIKELTRAGFYDGIVFHRVIDGFMAQTGDPTGTGTGGSDKPDLPAEFSDANYLRGTIGMARTSDPNSANSQFFICFTDTGCSFLKGQYTVVGQVTNGMEFIDRVAKGEPPSSPDKIMKMTVAADAPAAATPAQAAAPAAAMPTDTVGSPADAANASGTGAPAGTAATPPAPATPAPAGDPAMDAAPAAGDATPPAAME